MAMANRTNPIRRRGASFIGGLVAVLFWASPGVAQTGTVTGTVVDRSTNLPLNGVQVSVVGTNRGGLTDGRGRFVIPSVPAGQQTVEAVFIGYRTGQEQVTVTAGGTTTVEFDLSIAAVSLDEVIVTGTAGAVERRQLGASVASVDVNKVQETVPVADVGQVLQARIPGVRSIGNVGGVGASRDLRIRGTSSFSLGQRPVIYVDGVRIDTRQTEWGETPGSCCSFSGGAGEDRLGDINPNDIERIEVIKGPAAGTLFGSEGSNGVIQIFTKKGRSDSAPNWSLAATGGFQRYKSNFETKLYPRFTGPDGFRAFDANEQLIENGGYMAADATVQGGGNAVTYFVSGGYTDEQGSIQPNWSRRGNLRLNLHWLAGDKLSFDVTSAFTRNRIASLQSGNNWTSLLGNAILGVPYNACVESPTCGEDHRPYGEPWVSVRAIQNMETFDDAVRWTGGATINYNVSDAFTNKFQVGLDQVNEEKIRFTPFGYPYVYIPAGEKSLGYRNARTITLDYLGTLKYDLASSLGAQLSVGAQGFWDSERRNFALGRGYAGPGVTTVGGGTVKDAVERFEEEIQVGFYGQNRLAFQDKLFLTVGVRVDGNSAFGDNYGLQTYPNVQLSYDMTNETFVPSFFTQLRLRGAIGTSGLAPGAFDKFQTFTPFVALDDQSAIRADDSGNDELSPEKTTEFEGGFEAGFLNDRVGVEFTAFKAITKDALATIAVAPSAAFGDAPRSNIGELQNTGWEAAIRVTPIESRTLRWSTDLRLDGNTNKITDLGRDPAADTIILRRGGLDLGYPVLDVWTRAINGYDAATNKHTRTDTSVFFGPALPTRNISLGNELTFGAFRLYGLVTHESGAVFGHSDRPYRIRFRTGDEYLGLLDYSNCTTNTRCVESEMRTTSSDSLFDYMNLVTPVSERDNFRLREVTMTFTVPDGFTSRFGLGRTVLTLAAKNVQWWDDCHCMDPNMNYLGGADLSQASSFLGQPQPRQFLLSVRTTF
jgi:TonB-dependent SusC/RagA subfamily outer membrane receptor